MTGPETNTRGDDVLDVDSDAETLGDRHYHRPLHLHPGFIGLVVIGGTLGTLARYGLETVIPDPGGWPLATLLINIAGAFALGALMEGLVRRGPDTGRRRLIRLLAGTGFMGGFTTYSTLALEANLLLDANRVPDALLYLLASLILGAGATAVGIWAAATIHRKSIVQKHGSAEHSSTERGQS